MRPFAVLVLRALRAIFGVTISSLERATGDRLTVEEYDAIVDDLKARPAREAIVPEDWPGRATNG